MIYHWFLMSLTVLAAEPTLLDFSKIPSAHSPQESIEHWDLRARTILEQTALSDPGVLSKKNTTAFMYRILARLATGYKIAETNQLLLAPDTRVFGEIGSDFDRLSPICTRNGDWDFALKGLIPIYYHFKDQPHILWPETRNKILHELLNTFGDKFITKVKFGKICGPFKETENHVLQTESSRHLTNQLLAKEYLQDGKEIPKFIDNRFNGHPEKLITFMKHFLLHEFSEFNSRPYQIHTIIPLHNLVDFSEDPRVVTTARDLLDMLHVKYTLTSQDLFRSTPFRRQSKFKNHTAMIQIDKQSHLMFLLAGNLDRLKGLDTPYIVDFAAENLIVAALSRYRLPSLALKWFHGDLAPSLTRIKHEGIEITYKTPQYTLMGGGEWKNYFDFGTGENNAWAVATVLTVEDQEVDSKNMVRILGAKNEKRRSNICVERGFACGLRPRLPDSPHVYENLLVLPTKAGSWSFFTLAHQTQAIHNAPVHVALYKNHKGDYGFFEVATKEQIGSLSDFKQRVIQQNPLRDYSDHKTEYYVRIDGSVVRFRFEPKHQGDYPIESPPVTERKTKHWPLFSGDQAKVLPDGAIEFTDQLSGEQLILNQLPR